MAKDNFKEFNIRDSPFHEEYNIKTGKNLGGVKIHPDKYKYSWTGKKYDYSFFRAEWQFFF